jgi:hypothetical protein
MDFISENGHPIEDIIAKFGPFYQVIFESVQLEDQRETQAIYRLPFHLIRTHLTTLPYSLPLSLSLAKATTLAENPSLKHSSKK